jgi:hypothetical protein
MPTAAEYEARIKALGWDELSILWRAIQQGDTPHWESGKAFEYLILRTFELDDAQVRWPYQVELLGGGVEQIDGAVYCQGLSCLVESKDTAENVAIAPIAKLRNQLLRRPAGTVGLMFSRTGFTDSARILAHFALPQAILLWNGKEIHYALERKRMGAFLLRKYRACVENGLPDYNVREGEML